MTNLDKRILTSLVALPLSIYLLIIGGTPLTFFLIFILFIGMHELFTVFKRIGTKLFLSLILILSICSIYFLSNENLTSKYILFFAIAVSISSDIGGYVFGKIFKWKKLTKISPNKTISGVFGSYFFSFICLYVFNKYALEPINSNFNVTFLFEINEILLTVIFSTVAQLGDLTVSYFKRLDKIKDTGKILPGHGGILDRIDALMFVSILTFLLYFNHTGLFYI
tara:strand:+ start:481 stop:1152 length:672 start_codon:yes stop_codon:yes gene_type:complete